MAKPLDWELRVYRATFCEARRVGMAEWRCRVHGLLAVADVVYRWPIEGMSTAELVYQLLDVDPEVDQDVLYFQLEVLRRCGGR